MLIAGLSLLSSAFHHAAQAWHFRRHLGQLSSRLCIRPGKNRPLQYQCPWVRIRTPTAKKSGSESKERTRLKRLLNFVLRTCDTAHIKKPQTHATNARNSCEVLPVDQCNAEWVHCSAWYPPNKNGSFGRSRQYKNYKTSNMCTDGTTNKTHLSSALELRFCQVYFVMPASTQYYTASTSRKAEKRR